MYIIPNKKGRPDQIQDGPEETRMIYTPESTPNFLGPQAGSHWHWPRLPP